MFKFVSVILIMPLLLIACAAPVLAPAAENRTTLYTPDIYNYYAKYVGLLVEHETLKVSYDNLKSAIAHNSGGQQGLEQEIKLLKKQNEELAKAFSSMASVQHQTTVKYDSMTAGQESLVEQLDLVRGKHQRLVDQLVAIDNRTDNTTTSNLTAEERTIFYKMWDIKWPTFDWG